MFSKKRKENGKNTPRINSSIMWDHAIWGMAGMMRGEPEVEARQLASLFSECRVLLTAALWWPIAAGRSPIPAREAKLIYHLTPELLMDNYKTLKSDRCIDCKVFGQWAISSSFMRLCEFQQSLWQASTHFLLVDPSFNLTPKSSTSPSRH